MKAKFLLPLMFGLSAAMFVACSDDSSSSPNAPGTNPEEVLPGENNEGDQPGLPDQPIPEQPGQELPTNPEQPNPEQPTPDQPVTPGEEGGNTPDVPVVVPPEGMEPVKKVIENTIPNNEIVEVADFANYDYYGAELSGKEQFTYGRFEARMKMVSIPGSVSSMFLYYDPSYELGDEPWNEIDIEILGKNKGQWQSNLITREVDYVDETTGLNKKSPKQTSEFVTGFGFDATEDFHLYAMIWTPEYISWEIDSVEVRRDVIGMERPQKLKHDQVAFMTEEQTLRFNLWAAKSQAWVGQFTGAELADGPKAQMIDYVRVYSYDATTKTFKQEWQDDFDGAALDKTRWSVGTWDMEHVTLSAENVVVEDGYCKLLLSRKAK